MQKGVCFEHLNENSLLSNMGKLRTLAFNTIISVLRTTETRLDNTVSKEKLKIDAYNLFRSGGNKNVGCVPC